MLGPMDGPAGTPVIEKVAFVRCEAWAADVSVRDVDVSVPGKGLGATVAVTPGGRSTLNPISPFEPFNRRIGIGTVRVPPWVK